jgi:hypothetical protein
MVPRELFELRSMPTAPNVVALPPVIALLVVARHAGLDLAAMDERAITRLGAMPAPMPSMQ